jgi:hypothetical protein
MARVTLQVISAIANGDDSVIAAGARNTGAQLQMRFVGLNLTQMAVMTGKTVTVSASVSQLSFGAGGKMPYFGAVVKILSEETGDTWAYLPKCKIMSDFVPFQGEFGTFTTPELDRASRPRRYLGDCSPSSPTRLRWRLPSCRRLILSACHREALWLKRQHRKQSNSWRHPERLCASCVKRASC